MKFWEHKKDKMINHTRWTLIDVFATIADFQVNAWERCFTNACCGITDKWNQTYKLQIKSCHKGCLSPSTGCKIPPFNDFLAVKSIPILIVLGNKAPTLPLGSPLHSRTIPSPKFFSSVQKIISSLLKNLIPVCNCSNKFHTSHPSELRREKSKSHYRSIINTDIPLLLLPL